MSERTEEEIRQLRSEGLFDEADTMALLKKDFMGPAPARFTFDPEFCWYTARECVLTDLRLAEDREDGQAFGMVTLKGVAPENAEKFSDKLWREMYDRRAKETTQYTDPVFETGEGETKLVCTVFIHQEWVVYGSEATSRVLWPEQKSDKIIVPDELELEIGWRRLCVYQDLRQLLEEREAWLDENGAQVIDGACKHCDRSEDGKWWTPCPAPTCPSREGEAKDSGEEEAQEEESQGEHEDQ